MTRYISMSVLCLWSFTLKNNNNTNTTLVLNNDGRCFHLKTIATSSPTTYGSQVWDGGDLHKGVMRKSMTSKVENCI